MELLEAVGRRVMVRSFSSEPVDADQLDRLLRASGPHRRQHPGHGLGRPRGQSQTRRTGTPPPTRPGGGATPAGRRGLRRARWCSSPTPHPTAYVARYAESDKADPALGEGAHRWPVPYWFGDAAFGVMSVLLGAVDAGLGACLLGAFRGNVPSPRHSASRQNGGSSAPSSSGTPTARRPLVVARAQHGGARRPHPPRELVSGSDRSIDQLGVGAMLSARDRPPMGERTTRDDLLMNERSTQVRPAPEDLGGAPPAAGGPRSSTRCGTTCSRSSSMWPSTARSFSRSRCSPLPAAGSSPRRTATRTSICGSPARATSSCAARPGRRSPIARNSWCGNSAWQPLYPWMIKVVSFTGLSQTVAARVLTKSSRSAPSS